jgi:hypothetical protein
MEFTQQFAHHHIGQDERKKKAMLEVMVKNNKFQPSVNRIDNAIGDRKLIWTYPAPGSNCSLANDKN